MFDWGDLRYFLGVARHGSTIAAASALHLSQSTVHRRLVELERCIGRQLVIRHPTGYRLTEFGEELRPFVERVEGAVVAIERHLTATDETPTGTIRVTCSESIGYRLTCSP
jgi:DNA-binding transcriptional LysR family regulator